MRRLKSITYSTIAQIIARLCILLASPKWGWRQCPSCGEAYVDLDVAVGFSEHAPACTAFVDSLMTRVLTAKHTGTKFDA